MSKSINKTQLIKADAETALYERIRELIVTARQTVARGVDLVQVYTNYEIGRHIVEHEQQGEKRATYGKEVLNLLSDKLIAEFGKGFSRSNLEYMRRFYLTYPTSRNIPQTPSGEFLSIQKSQMASGKSNLSGSSIPSSDGMIKSQFIMLMGKDK